VTYPLGTHLYILITFSTHRLLLPVSIPQWDIVSMGRRYLCPLCVDMFHRELVQEDTVSMSSLPQDISVIMMDDLRSPDRRVLLSHIRLKLGEITRLPNLGYSIQHLFRTDPGSDPGEVMYYDPLGSLGPPYNQSCFDDRRVAACSSVRPSNSR